MKICANCSAQNDDKTNFCPYCGSSSFSYYYNQQPQSQPQTGLPVLDTLSPSYISPLMQKNNGNIFLGIIGAVLFSLAGVLLYCLSFQAGIISGAASAAIYFFAYKGYEIFSGSKGAYSPVKIVVSIVTIIVMVIFSEYISLGITLMLEFGWSLEESLNCIPDLLNNAELSEAVLSDLLFAFVFGAIAVISNIRKIMKARNNK